MSRIRELYLLLVIVFSGQALEAFRSHEGLIVLWSVGLVIFWRECMRPRRVLLYALAAWIAYFVVSTVTIGSFHPFFMGTYVAKIMIAYWLLTHFGVGLFERFESTVSMLALVSLGGFALQVAAPGSLTQVMQRIDLSGGIFEGAYASVGIFSLHFQDTAGFARNSGFAWEPGPFSCFLAFAIFVNVARNGFILKNKFRLALLLITLLTTQSSTGALLLMILAIWFVWIRFRGSLLKPLIIPFTLALAVGAYTTVPWLGNKIADEYSQSIDDVLAHAYVTGKSYNPGRFASLELRWRDFRNYPIAGYGGNPTLQYGYLGEENVVYAVGGLGGALAQYGAIGFVAILVLFFRSGQRLASVYQCEVTGLLPALLIVSALAFNVFETPIIVTFWFTALFLRVPRADPGAGL